MKRPQLVLLLERRRSWLEGAGWALSLIGFASFAAFVWESILRDGGAAYDLHAYVLAGRNFLQGAPLYGPMEINDPGAYRYPPTFAALAVPLTLPPEEVVTWAYRAACLGCVRYLVGSWRAVCWALLVIPLQVELIALNVTLPIAAAARVALRGPAEPAGAALIPITAALKFGTILLGAYLWVVRPDLRRPMIAGAVGADRRLRAARAARPGLVAGISQLARPASRVGQCRPVGGRAAPPAGAVDARRLRAAPRHRHRVGRDRHPPALGLAGVRRGVAGRPDPLACAPRSAGRRPQAVAGR